MGRVRRKLWRRALVQALTRLVRWLTGLLSR